MIDVDSSYLGLFEDFFEDEPTIIQYFGVGAEFLKLNPSERAKLDYVVINHNLFDMKGVELLDLCRESIKGKVCIISSQGDELTDEDKKRLDITGDFGKQDYTSLLDWYNNKTPMIEGVL